MTRSHCYSALMLRSRPSGESNRDVWLLTSETGLIRATVFGGPKSKLRSYASPFHSGQAWVYHDPVKDNRKLTDFDVRSWRPGLRELYERAMAADSMAETILASHGGGGNWGRALSLAEAVLDALAKAGSDACARLALWFLWQWTDFLGIRPELDRCSSCGASSGILRYSRKEGGMACDSCSGTGIAGFMEAGPGCRRWLETIRPLSPDKITRFTLDAKSFIEAKTLVTAILAEALGRRPASWDW